MSYTIEYEHQFIRSNAGITPCWLAGDNNVTEMTSGGRERRARDWSVFHNLLGVTQEEILKAIEPFLGGYGEHWMRNGKWVDDDALIRWVKSNCKKAMTIEEILKANCLRSITCYLSVWKGNSWEQRQNSVYVHSDEEFDKWVAEAKECIRTKADDERIYPVIDFVREKLMHVTPVLSEKVVLRYGDTYLSAVFDGQTSWAKDIKKALVFTREECEELRRTHTNGWIRQAKPVNANAQSKPYDAVLRFEDGQCEGRYISRIGRKNIYCTYSIANAHHYPDIATAERTIAHIRPSVKKLGTLRAVRDEAAATC